MSNGHEPPQNAGSASSVAVGSVPPITPPAAQLAGMLRRDLNLNVDSRSLELFVLARWKRLSALAHAIHDAGADKE